MSHVTTHIKCPGQDPDAIFYTMLCGAECMIMDDGVVIPNGFDFYSFRDGQQATCVGCRGLVNLITLFAANQVFGRAQVNQ